MISLLSTAATLLGAMAAPLPPDAYKEAASALEAKVRHANEATADAAKPMLELIGLAQEQGDVFTLADVAQRFAQSQTQHVKHRETMAQAIAAASILARHADVTALGRQYLDRYKDGAEAGQVARQLGHALARQRSHLDAGLAFKLAYEKLGAMADAEAAVEQFYHAEKREGYSAAAELLGNIAAAVPPAQALGPAYWGAYYARRAEQWELSAKIIEAYLAKNPPLEPRQKQELLTMQAEGWANAGQPAPAAALYRVVTAQSASADTWRSYVRALYDAKAKPEEILAAGEEMWRKFPRSDYRWNGLALATHAFHNAGNLAKRNQLSARVLAGNPWAEDLLGHFINWNGDKPEALLEAERTLLGAIQQTNDVEAASYLRTALALAIYRDRLQKKAEAISVARDVVDRGYINQGSAVEIFGLLLESAKDQAAFDAELSRILRSIQKAMHHAPYRDALGQWLAAARQNQDLKDRAEWARPKIDEFYKSESYKWWKMALGEGLQGREQRDALLGQELSPSQRAWLLERQGDGIRHYGGEHDRKNAVPYFRKLAELEPKNATAARKWLDSVGYAEAPDQRAAAVEHFLKLPPSESDPGAVRSMMWIARETNNVAMAKQALAWAEAMEKQFGAALDHASDIGSSLDKLGLTSEAMTWWNAHWPLDLSHWESNSCVQQIMGKMENDAAGKLALVRKLQEKPHNFHGAYASWMADWRWQAGDVAGMEEIMRAARKLQDERPFLEWGIGEYPGRNWLDAARSNEKLTPEQKIAVFRLVRDMKIGRESSIAQLLLWEHNQEVPAAPLDRLAALASALYQCESSYQSWERLWGFVEAALARKDDAQAAVLLTHLVNSIGGVDKKQLDEARALARQASVRCGALGLDETDGPLAPLLQIGLHLRLGEKDLAKLAYEKNRDAFDQSLEQLPLELLLFAAEQHTAAATEKEFERAEDLLRRWLIKFAESKTVVDTDKARVQLALARNYLAAGRYEIARTEFTTLLNSYGKTAPEAALEARFGMGEAFMEQKIYDQAEEVFGQLAENASAAISARATFLRGVLASRRGDKDIARGYFRAVLDRMPDAELANRVLYQLAEVSGYQQRYLEQLELLRTIGRLGRISKRWHTPGRALAIVVQDADLSISRGLTRLPVVVKTQPGNDQETLQLKPGGVGKGLFQGELPTTLGAAAANDGVLQLMGSDSISVDYPDSFKQEFRFAVAAGQGIRISADAKFAMGSAIPPTEEQAKQAAEAPAEEANFDERLSEKRPLNQLKPGNPIYVRVNDPDRDLTPGPDKISLRVLAASGDTVTADLIEQGNHTGVFLGQLATGELPAGATASDAALDHGPLLAIDQDPKTAWASEPDSQPNKWLAVDLKDVKSIGKVTVTLADPKQEIRRLVLQGGNDGHFWYPLGRFDPQWKSEHKVELEMGKMTRRVWPLPHPNAVEGFRPFLEWMKKHPPAATEPVTTMSWKLEGDAENAKKSHAVLWAGKFVQRKPGAVRFSVPTGTWGLWIDGHVEKGFSTGKQTALDLFLDAGWHDLVILAVTHAPTEGLVVERARERSTGNAPNPSPFTAADFDLESADALAVKDAEIKRRDAKVESKDGVFTFALTPWQLRRLRLSFEDFSGAAVSVAHMVVESPDAVTLIPTEADLIGLTKNAVLEIAPGDTITGTYVDEFTEDGVNPNRILAAELTATYDNGSVAALAQEVRREGDGTLTAEDKELLRVEPGQRIIAEVRDYDLDTTGQADEIKVRVQINQNAPVELTATETGPTTGIFRCEVETASQTDGGKLGLKIGDRLYLRYTDTHNTAPGNTVERETVVLVNEPTDGKVRILASRWNWPAELENAPAATPRPVAIPQILTDATDSPARVAYGIPLTVEVIDPDAARDSRSAVVVEISTSQGTKLPVRCVLSTAFAPETERESSEESVNPALLQGRFIGQVMMQLGGPASPSMMAAVDAPGGLIGGPLPPERKEGEAVADNPRTVRQALIPVLNVSGEGEISVQYHDALRKSGDPQALAARGKLVGDATLAATEEKFESPVTIVHCGEKLYVSLVDADRDVSDTADSVLVRLQSERGEDEMLPLVETLSHSGVFTGVFPLKAVEKATPGNTAKEWPHVEVFFGEKLTLSYQDGYHSQASAEPLLRQASLRVAPGTDGTVVGFSKVFGNEDLAVQTQFTIAESYFEMFKGHLKLERHEEAKADLQAGRRTLRELIEDFPSRDHTPRAAYLLGQFSQELKEWDSAIEAYQKITREFPEHNLAPDAQYKLGQCLEEAGRFDEALEAYVTLAATWPQSPLIASVMVRINDRFYKEEKYSVAAQVAKKFLERFANHEWAPRLAFRMGQCYYKAEDYTKAGEAFDAFMKSYAEDELASQALFWAGESYRMAKNVPLAFRRYNRCRWDYPESEAAKFSRGRLALPEMLEQFEREAQVEDE